MGNPFGNVFRFRKSISPARKNLWIVNLEAVPAMIFFQLMGGPFLTGYLVYLGANSQEIGLVIAFSTLVSMVQIAMALLMQKVRNRKVLMIIGVLLFRLLWLSVALIPLFVPQESAVLVYGVLFTTACIFNASGGVVWASLISDVVPANVRGRFFGIRNALLGALGSVALFVGGQILDAHPGGPGFTILFLICAVMIVINTIFLFLYPNFPFEQSAESNAMNMIRKPIADRNFLKAMMFIAFYVLLLNITVPLFSYVMLEVLHLSYSWVSTIIIIHTLATMLGSYFWGNLNARYSNQTLLYYTLPFLAVGCLLWGVIVFIPAIVVLIVLHIVLGVGLGGFNQLVFNFLIGDTPKTERPMYFAVFSAVTGAFGFLGPFLGGYLYEWAKSAPDWIELYGISVAVGATLMIYGVVVGRRVLRNV